MESAQADPVNIPDRERQLENNVTKALINTLDLGGDGVCAPFLAWLGLEDVPNAKFLLQRRNLPTVTAAEKRCRVLLGISKKDLDWADSGVNVTYGSIPDAWVYGDKFAVLVESKVNDAAFSQKQMQAHLARLRSTEHGPPQVISKTWGQVHTFFARLLPRLSNDSSAKLLVEQFMEFLDYSGMSEFTGFRLGHFSLLSFA